MRQKYPLRDVFQLPIIAGTRGQALLRTAFTCRQGRALLRTAFTCRQSHKTGHTIFILPESAIEAPISAFMCDQRGHLLVGIDLGRLIQ